MSTKEEQQEEAEMHKLDQKIFQAFDKYDVEKFGYISVGVLNEALKECGYEMSVDEVYWIISVQDP